MGGDCDTQRLISAMQPLNAIDCASVQLPAPPISVVSCDKMFTARKKIVKERGVEPDELEEQVAQVNMVMVCGLPHMAVFDRDSGLKREGVCIYGPSEVFNQLGHQHLASSGQRGVHAWCCQGSSSSGAADWLQTTGYRQKCSAGAQNSGDVQRGGSAAQLPARCTQHSQKDPWQAPGLGAATAHIGSPSAAQGVRVAVWSQQRGLGVRRPQEQSIGGAAACGWEKQCAAHLGAAGAEKQGQ
jgi:hypothetical protein